MERSLLLERYTRYEKLPPLSKECFVMAPFGSEGSPERSQSDRVLEVIADAASKFGLTAVRADQITVPGDIMAPVKRHLRARAGIADLTDLDPNVIEELARRRHALGLPVIQMAPKGTVLPFNIEHMWTIYFDPEDPAKCRDELVAGLREVLKTPILVANARRILIVLSHKSIQLARAAIGIARNAGNTQALA